MRELTSRMIWAGESCFRIVQYNFNLQSHSVYNIIRGTYFRCVLMVGLPYPNMTSPELKEKMDYLNKTMVYSDVCEIMNIFHI